MRTLLCCLVALALTAAEPLGPGHHKKLPVLDGDWTWDAYVPASYAVDGSDRWPVLYLSSPTSHPGTFDLHGWAEERGVIIVGINDSENGQTGAEQTAIQEAVLASVEARLRPHPHLNFAAGISGGANSSLALVGRRPEQFAGVLLQCMSGSPRAGHIGVSWIHGAKDDVLGVGGVWSGYDRLKGTGRATVVVNRSRKHTPGSREEKEAAMEHLLWWGRLNHPGLEKEERRVYYQMLDEAMAATAEIADVEARLKRIEFLAGQSNADQAPNYAAMVDRWQQTWMDRIETEDDPGLRLEYLMTMGQHQLAKRMPRERKQQCAEWMKPLKRDEAALAHYEATTTFWKLFEMEQRAGLSDSALREVQEGFAALAATFPDHRWGQYAAKDARRLAKHLGLPTE